MNARRSRGRVGGWRWVVAAGLALLAGCGTAARPSLSGRVPSRAKLVGDVALPEVRATGADSTFHFRAAPGHLLVVYFGYTTCPDVCPTTLADLHHALEKLGPEASRVGLAFVTVDRQRDTPEQLVPYVTTFVAGGHALRPASDAQLASAEHAFGASSTITRGADGSEEVSHSAVGYLVDERGVVVDEWDFGTSSDAMAHDLRALIGPAKG